MYAAPAWERYVRGVKGARDYLLLTACGAARQCSRFVALHDRVQALGGPGAESGSDSGAGRAYEVQFDAFLLRSIAAAKLAAREVELCAERGRRGLQRGGAALQRVLGWREVCVSPVHALQYMPAGALQVLCRHGPLLCLPGGHVQGSGGDGGAGCMPGLSLPPDARAVRCLALTWRVVVARGARQSRRRARSEGK